MKKRLGLVLIILIAVVVVGIVLLVLPEPEPVYQGKRLSSWLAQYAESSDRGVQEKQAAEAIRIIGTNALPVHDASAGTAPHEIEFLVAPRVADSRAASSGDPHFRWLVIGPERSIPPANGAIAAREAARLARYPDFDRAAVAGSDEHGASPIRMVVRALGDG